MRNLKFYTIVGIFIIVLSLTIALAASVVHQSTFDNIIRAEANAKIHIFNSISGDFLKKLDQLN